MIVTFDPVTSIVTLSGAGWRGSFPISELPAQLALYRGLRDRRNRAFAAHYEETVQGLERVQRLAREAAAVR